MITKWVVDALGKLLEIHTNVSEQNFIEVPDGLYVIDGISGPLSLPQFPLLWYFDFSSYEFVMTRSPEEYMEFDYTDKSWKDFRSLSEIKVKKWESIKAQRTSLEHSGFEFEGNIYDSDQVSQGRIMNAALAGIDQVWTLADNTTSKLTASQMQQLYVAMSQHVAAIHERGCIARAAIEAAQTKEEVEAIVL